MITIQDCIGLCSLTEAEVDAIAEHEHLPGMVAVELGFWLARTPEGQGRILWMIEDDIGVARSHRRWAHMRDLQDTRIQYLETHPAVH